MYCKKCGEEIKTDSKFCRKCGTLLQSDSEQIEDKYYFADSGENKGPYSISELKKLFQDGVLKENFFVWKEGMERWVQANTIETFQDIFLQGRSIRCDVCGRYFSDREKECPYCKINAEKKLKRDRTRKVLTKTVLCITTILLLIFTIVFFFKNIYLTTDDRQAVANTMAAITELSSIDQNSGDEIAHVEKMYDELSEKCEEL